eukprot:361878-Rhodomonas_salina.1
MSGTETACATGCYAMSGTQIAFATGCVSATRCPVLRRGVLRLVGNDCDRVYQAAGQSTMRLRVCDTDAGTDAADAFPVRLLGMVHSVASTDTGKRSESNPSFRCPPTFALSPSTGLASGAGTQRRLLVLRERMVLPVREARLSVKLPSADAAQLLPIGRPVLIQLLLDRCQVPTLNCPIVAISYPTVWFFYCRCCCPVLTLGGAPT